MGKKLFLGYLWKGILITLLLVDSIFSYRRHLFQHILSPITGVQIENIHTVRLHEENYVITRGSTKSHQLQSQNGTLSRSLYITPLLQLELFSSKHPLHWANQSKIDPKERIFQSKQPSERIYKYPFSEYIGNRTKPYLSIKIMLFSFIRPMMHLQVRDTMIPPIADHGIVYYIYGREAGKCGTNNRYIKQASKSIQRAKQLSPHV